LIPKHNKSLLRASLFLFLFTRSALLNQISTIHDQEKEKHAQKPYCSPKSLNVRLLLLATPTVVLLLLTVNTLYLGQPYSSRKIKER